MPLLTSASLLFRPRLSSLLPQRWYIPTARELQRLESVTRSPIYSKFSEALAGVATIRAYRREAYFTAASDALMELNAAAFVSQRAAAGWLALRLDLLGVLVILLTGGCFVSRTTGLIRHASCSACSACCLLSCGTLQP